MKVVRSSTEFILCGTCWHSVTLFAYQKYVNISSQVNYYSIERISAIISITWNLGSVYFIYKK
jgi:hypothetical protein